MAQTGFTPIQLYSSSTATNVPLAANLATGELAINITDGKLFYKDNANAVQVIGWKTVPTSAGGTGLTSYAAGDTVYYATGAALSKLTIGANNSVMTSTGSAPQWSTALTLSGNVTAAAFIPSGSTVPTNGLYLPAANSVALATNSNYGVYVNSSQQVFLGGGNSTAITNEKVNITSTNAFPIWAQTSAVGGSIFTRSGAVGSANNIFISVGNGYNYGVIGTVSATGASNGDVYGLGHSASAGAAFSAALKWDTNAQDVTVTAGNLVIGTSGKGIDFSATAGTGTSELLADYEEGTWTPGADVGLTVIGTFSSSGKYTRIGRIVYIQGVIAATTSVAFSSGSRPIKDIPFTSGSGSAVGLGFNDASNATACVYVGGGGIYLYAANTLVATPSFSFSATYLV